MDNLPSWSAYPKRNQSFICTTSSEYADEYGSVYRVYPKNGTKFADAIGDIWQAFNYFNVEWLSNDLYGLAKSQGVTLSETDFAVFKQQTTNLDLTVDLTKFSSLSKVLTKLAGHGYKKNNLFEILEHIVSPGNSNCGLVSSLKQLPDGYTQGCEVWFEGEAWMAPSSYKGG